MTFEILILGTSAAVQANGRHQSAQVLKLDNHYFLIDCGEGTQEQIALRKLNFNKISKIFISHLHGDHFLGLFGFLSTMSLLGRSDKIEVYGPKGLREIITTQLKYSQSYFSYPVEFIETTHKDKTIIFEDPHIEVSSFPLDHSIACTGFLFKEKTKLRKLISSKLPKKIDFPKLRELKKGIDIELEDGTTLFAYEVSHPPQKSKSYAYCSDTAYNMQNIEYVKGVDILYHESTFLSKHADKAKNTRHSTSIEAATIASEAKVGKLLLGHFSARYSDIKEFEKEAQTIFEKSVAAIEGETYKVSDTL